MEFELRMTVSDGHERHAMQVGFGEEDKGEVVSSLASSVLTLLLDVVEEGISGGWDDQVAESGSDREWSSDTVEKLRPLLGRRGGSWLRYFQPPVDVVPLEDLYEFAAAFNEAEDEEAEGWRDDQATLIVLLASAQIGKNLDDLAAYTGLPVQQVRRYAERLWLNGVWEAGKAYWPNLGHGMVLTKDSMVAEGIVCRVPGTDAWTITEAYRDVDLSGVDELRVEAAR